MKRITQILIPMLILGLVICLTRPVLALWLKVSITKSCMANGQDITVTTKQVDQFTEFDITITPHPTAVSPFLLGQLSLVSNDKWIASVPVSEKRDNGKVTFWFRVTPDALAQSSFEISASAYAPTTKDNSPFATVTIGKQKYEQLMGGAIFDFKLKDFAGAK